MNIKNENKIPIFGGKVIIITGGIGSGKSYIMRCLSCFGFITFNTDKAIHKLMSPEGDAYNQIITMFPKAVVGEIVDRKKLGDMVFNDAKLLSALENILYPLLQEYRLQWVQSIQAKSKRSIAIEVPLFFEKPSLLANQYDFVVTAICEVALQRSRALRRVGASLDKVNKIISMQVENDYRIKKTNFVIDTNKNRVNTVLQLLRILKWQ